MSGKSRGRKRRSGYVIEQLLITLAVCAFLIPVITIALGSLLRALQVRQSFQDEAAIAQLRHVINVSTEIETDGSSLTLTCHGNEMTLALRNGNLDLLSPGTQIFLTELESASFEIEGELIYLTYEREGKEPVRRCLGISSRLCVPVLSGDVSSDLNAGGAVSVTGGKPAENSPQPEKGE